MTQAFFDSDLEHLDVVIVGAGLSGIGAAHHLQERLPGKNFTILESRAAIGGTWDLFRYPGVRSDSDMFTMGYGFRPWHSDNAIADGASIRAYINATAAEASLDRKVRFGHKLVRASWSSAIARWTLDIEVDGAASQLTCNFLFMCAGYYDYESGYTPDFPGEKSFAGTLVHPQAWPEGLDVAGKRVVVIGSGATAVTLVPALTARGAEVKMLQRSPSYIISLPAKDRFAKRMQRLLPAGLAFQLVRWRNILISYLTYRYARRKPDATRAKILGLARKKLGPGYDVGKHFNPRYNPWDQRLCMMPDDDLFDALKSGKAEIVTDEIDTFTEAGIALRSGSELAADIVVTATGLKLRLNGGVVLTIDGQPADLSQAMSYKGLMLSNVPNLAYVFGYTNASWTLKSDLTSAWVCRMLAYMDRRGFTVCVPRPASDVSPIPLIDFSSGYIQRAIAEIPKQGDRKPWRLNQNYLRDLLILKLSPINDGTLSFMRAPHLAKGSAASAATAAR